MSIGRWSARAGSILTILPRVPTHFFDGAPEHLREKLREDAQFRVAENYLLSGLGRHAPDEDIDLAVRSLFALSVQLGDKPYLMGDTPCGTDATAFGALAGILTPFFVSTLRDEPSSSAISPPMSTGMMLQYYPDFCLDAADGKPPERSDAPRCGAGSPFNAASSASSSAIRASRTASAARHIGGVEFLRDVLRAVGVPGRDLEQDHLLGPRLVALRHQRSQQRRIVVDHPRLAPDLDPAAMGIVHHENMRLGVFRQIALGDVLPVAAVIGERQRGLVQHFDKALRAAAMLDVRLAIGVGGGEKEAVGLAPEMPRVCHRFRCATRRFASTLA